MLKIRFIYIKYDCSHIKFNQRIEEHTFSIVKNVILLTLAGNYMPTAKFTVLGKALIIYFNYLTFCQADDKWNERNSRTSLHSTMILWWTGRELNYVEFNVLVSSEMTLGIKLSVGGWL